MRLMKSKFSRTWWELFFMLVLVFPLLVYLSSLKFGEEILIWFLCIGITPIAWLGLTYKTKGFWKIRGKIAWWMWLYFMTGTAIAQTFGKLMFLAFGNIFVWIPFIPFTISMGLYNIIHNIGNDFFFWTVSFFQRPTDLFFFEWSLEASDQLYFVVVTLLIVYGSILIAKWRYKPEDESEEKNDCKMTKDEP